MPRCDADLRVHFIEKKTGKMIAQLYCHQVPAVGDECRFTGDRYFKVVQVVHVYDEDVPYHRANVGLEAIK